MKSKKNVLMSLSVFIAVVFILTLFGQQPQKGALWDAVKDHELRIIQLEERVAELRANESEILHQLNTHTHDYSELTGNVHSHIHDSSEIVGIIDADTLQGSDASAFAPSAHAHDYSDISNPPSIPTEAEIISLINENALGEPDYDSGLIPIDTGSPLTLYHNLGGDHENYLVDLQFWNTYLGYHTLGYGIGIEYIGDRFYYLGAYMRDLSNQSICVYRPGSDPHVQWGRVRIWKYR